MKFTIGLLLGLSLASALAQVDQPTATDPNRPIGAPIQYKITVRSQVNQPAATNPCRLVLRDNAVVMNVGLYNLMIETQGENIIFESNDITFAGEPCEKGACRGR